MEKDLTHLINIIKALHDRLGSKAWKGEMTMNLTDNIEALLDLGDCGSAMNLPNKYRHDCLFSIFMSYVKGVKTGLKEINNAIREQR